MSREEAKLDYPVKVRGVITFVWPNAGTSIPQIGEYREVEGETFAGFAPDIFATHAARLGAGMLPEPEHPNWT
jgi:hypothetical protein